ncbi:MULTISPECIES: tautomerase family protein [unclassified Clostridium]|uniref:tautomerase family protein n=1 Tax=unclassified Clostridium TaxID=2614128 RepID=UPI001FA9807D|nr:MULTISPECIES: tautomerase family protein [unclassified Clostridium]
MMPHIAIAMIPGRDEATKQRLAERMKSALIDELGVPENWVSVSLHEIARENWQDVMEQIGDEAMLIRADI